MNEVPIPSLLSLDINYWFLQTCAMIITAILIPGLKISGPFGAFITVVSLALVNAKLWDTALFFNIPNSLTVHTGALFLANGIIFLILVKLLPGIEVEGILPALVAPVVFTVCSLIISQYGEMIDWMAILTALIGLLTQLRDYFLETSPDAVEPLKGAASPALSIGLWRQHRGQKHS